MKALRLVVLPWVCCTLLAAASLASTFSSAHALEIKTGVLKVEYPALPPVSRYDEVPEDLGFAGAQLGNEDNATTGSFLGHSFALDTRTAAPEAAEAAVKDMVSSGVHTLVLIANGADTERLAKAAGDGVIVFNAAAPDDDLRGEKCLANLLHVAPSRAMLADAVAEFVLWKRWPRWFLIEGSNPADKALGEAYRRAAVKFGAKIVEERVFEDTGGSRRTDSGLVMVQRQIPVFTQDAEEHDVVIAADESDVFAPYLPFHTWTPRPVAGSAGLRPVTFHAAHEAWGATQFQRRFEKLTGRYVRPVDYNTWLAVRVVGEAVTRTGSDDPAALRSYVLGKDFELAAFKGQKVTFRDWDGQMRQPILLTDSRITVSVSPQEGFLHQFSPLDTLGIDRPETSCKAFAQ
ncbi:ABC transporter substrate-binding protein [Roseibium suaedae]|uniref:Amino acid/amide ABC transporter substrate-binding protein, HAAT family n=1 Tax=Roseibium suaedae TaxID=735517 RepID=A0A1M7PPD8_9HYPH|nr:ABC transporter substrate-binding protein [Roseibium suaedae]SHN19205.1 amino acid/amide ABC transporter substrate-binding protein, HAAT family [Roseibium suaedae]